jgi:hypothetical protein
MTVSQEIAMSLFTKETLQQVKAQFKSGENRTPIECFNMSFRLFRASEENINLELLIQMALPDDGYEEVDLGTFGKARSTQSVMFFKPIGFFKLKKNFFSEELDVTIVKEFEKDLDYLIENKKIPSGVITNKLNFVENAVLAAFSMEALLRAQKYEDVSFYANGLKADIFMSFDGYPQVFLDDSYNFPGPIAAYMIRETNSVNPIIDYQDIFNRFNRMSLMTAFKRI